MPRGGYQKPSKPAAVSGPGKFSKRTDGQPSRAPDLDTPGQQFGDRERLEAAQRAVPAAGAQGATVQRNLRGSVPTRGKLPGFLFGESAIPDEPGTTGLPMGPGAGPEALAAAEPPDDIREVVLDYLANTFQNATAVRHLADIRAERSAPTPPSAMQVPLGPSLESTPTPEEPTEPTA